MGGLIGCMIISGRAMAPVGQIAQVLGRFNVSMQCYNRVDKFMQVTNREEEARAYVERSELKEVQFLPKPRRSVIQPARPSFSTICLSKLKRGRRSPFWARLVQGKLARSHSARALYT